MQSFHRSRIPGTLKKIAGSYQNLEGASSWILEEAPFLCLLAAWPQAFIPFYLIRLYCPELFILREQLRYNKNSDIPFIN